MFISNDTRKAAGKVILFVLIIKTHVIMKFFYLPTPAKSKYLYKLIRILELELDWVVIVINVLHTHIFLNIAGVWPSVGAIRHFLILSNWYVFSRGLSTRSLTLRTDTCVTHSTAHMPEKIMEKKFLNKSGREYECSCQCNKKII